MAHAHAAMFRIKCWLENHRYDWRMRDVWVIHHDESSGKCAYRADLWRVATHR